ncbi:MAG: SEL1-like repeat protein [Oscillospiraceae bacterium]|nr:SEL1-like repeat protein [Oscillospiraceae bacterium]
MGLFSKKTDKEIIAEGRSLYIKGDLSGANLKLIKLAIKGNAEACYWVGRICLEEADKNRDEKRREIGKVYLEKGVRLGNKDAAELLKKEFEQPDSNANKEEKTVINAKAKAEEKQPAPQQTVPAKAVMQQNEPKKVAPQPEPAQPQKTEQQLRAEIEAELRAKMEEELKAKIEAELQAKLEAELTAKLEAEEQQKAKIQENAEKTVVEARNLCAKGDIDTAEKMLAELLAEMPDFRSAQYLMQEIQDVKAWEKEKAEKERAERAAKEKAEAEARAKAEAQEKERLKAELRAKTEAKVRAEMEAERKAKQEAEAKAKAQAEEKARLEKLAKEAEEQPAPAENRDEIFTPQRLAIMDAVAAEGRERQRKLKEENRDHWADELDKIEELYRSGDYKHAFLQASMYEEASARAINMMGAMYLTGRGTEKDLIKAREYFELARRIGYLPARYNAAMMMLQTGGDEEEAFNMMEHIADEGYLPAMLQAGKMYIEGIGVAENEEEGWFWLCQAARNGHVETAHKIVKLFFEQPEKIYRLRGYLDILCAAGDIELTKKIALLLMNGIPGKMMGNLNLLRRYRDILKNYGYTLDDLRQ